MPIPVWSGQVRRFVVMHVVLIFCLALLLVSCGALPESDPRGEWRMEEWSSVIEEGRAFHESKRRPWSQRLEL